MFYREWGFTENPFLTEALPPTELGSKPLVGRDHLVRTLKRRLDNPSKIATVEGLNGVGKTSLINVTVYRAFKEALRSGLGPFYFPCRKIFQLENNADPDDFRRRVLMEVAQTLIEIVKEIPPPRGRTRHSKKQGLTKFLNDPHVHSYSAGAWLLNVGFNKETNTGVGFEESGLDKAVTSWLEETFPAPDRGGIVCVIDNLELLQTSQKARDTLENLRDTLFSIAGIRWVLCGALGIIHGVASSPRLDGRLHKPINVTDLGEAYAGDIFTKRVRAFRQDMHAKLPMGESNFVELFEIMRGNIRSVLSECDEFCSWVADRVEDMDEFEPTMFDQWLEEELENAYGAVRSELRPTAMRVFETACQFEVFSPSDCTTFGYKTPQAMRPQIKALETLGILVSSVDETDKRRKTIQVTPKGWKVRAFLDFVDDEEKI